MPPGSNTQRQEFLWPRTATEATENEGNQRGIPWVMVSMELTPIGKNGVFLSRDLYRGGFVLFCLLTDLLLPSWALPQPQKVMGDRYELCAEATDGVTVKLHMTQHSRQTKGGNWSTKFKHTDIPTSNGEREVSSRQAHTEQILPLEYLQGGRHLPGAPKWAQYEIAQNHLHSPCTGPS